MRSLVTLALALAALCVNSAAAAEKRLLDCTQQSQSLSDCDAMGYLVRVATFIIPGLLIGLFMILFCCPGFFCGRYCCGCCGSSKPTSGCCCGGAPAQYGTMDLVRPKIWAVVVLGMGLGGGVWGMLSSQQAVTGLRGMADSVQGMPDVLINHLTRIETALTVPTYDRNTDTSGTRNLFANSSLSSKGQELKNQTEAAVKDNLDQFRTYVDRFSFIMYILFAVPMGLVLFGAVGGALNCRSCLPMLLVFFMFLFGGFLWIGNGLFSGVALLTGDLCAELTGIVEDKKTILPPVTGCNSSDFAAFTDNFISIENSVAGDACVAMRALCYDATRTALQNAQSGSVFDCGSGFSCNNVRFGDLVDIVEQQMQIDARVAGIPSARSLGYTCSTINPCRPPDCADDCLVNGARSDVGKGSKEMYVQFLAASQVATTLDTLGGEYGSCEALMSLVFGPFALVCTDLSGGFMALRNSSGIIGVTVFAFVFVMSWGQKRFMSSADAEAEAEAEVTETEMVETTKEAA